MTFDHEWIPFPPGVPGRYSGDHGYSVVRGAVPPAPAWLRNLIGDEYFRDVRSVEFSGLTISESDLSALARLPSVEIVCLSYTRVTPEGDTVPRLVHDADLKVLEHHNNLRELHLDETDVEGFGLKYLINIPTLKWLNLLRTRVNDAGLEQIGKLNGLERLDLAVPGITDIGLRHISGLPQLTFLDLGGTEVTDAGLQYLRGLRQLTNLGLDGTRVTPEGIAELQKSLPNCKITGP